MAERLLEYLNNTAKKAGSERYRSYAGLRERLREGAMEEEARLVIDYKAAQWLDDDTMAYCVRPKTLFGKENFPGYLAEARGWESKGRPKIGRNGKADKLQRDLDATRAWALEEEEAT
jgi:uncharacterized phage protein (TIGR02220 family)